MSGEQADAPEQEALLHAWEYNVEAFAQEHQESSSPDAPVASDDGPLHKRVQIQFSIPSSDREEEEAVASKNTTLPIAPPSPDSRSTATSCLLHSTRQWLLTRTFSAQQTPQAQSDDDDSSTNSAPYFEPTDFDAANWIQAMDAPTVGFAVFGLAMVLTHPILFLAGLATALGAATAASRGYDCFVDGACSHWLPSSSTDCTETRALLKFGQNLTQKDEMEDDKTANDSGTESSSSSTVASTRPLEETKTRPEEQQVVTQTPESSTIWLEQHYPALNTSVVTDQAFVGLNVIEFFHVFFDDDAPYNFKEFQKKRGDLDISYGKWQPPQDDNTLSSMHPNATDFELHHYHLHQTRVLTFQAKTNNGLLGPAYAKTRKMQRLLILSKRLAVLEMKTCLANIPFGDRFFVLERWIFCATRDSVCYTTRVNVSMGVFFTGHCPFESPIRTKSAAAVCEVVQAWCAMARQALELTQQAKLHRLQQETDDLSSALMPHEEEAMSTMSSWSFSPKPKQLQEETEQQQQPSLDDEIELHLSHDGCVHNDDDQQDVALRLTRSEPVVKRRRRLGGLRRTLSSMVKPRMEASK